MNYSMGRWVRRALCVVHQLEAAYKYISILSLINYQENDPIRETRQMNKFKLKIRCERPTEARSISTRRTEKPTGGKRTYCARFAIYINTSIVCRLLRVNPAKWAMRHRSERCNLQRLTCAVHTMDWRCTSKRCIHCIMSLVQWEPFLCVLFLLFCFFFG